MPSILSTSCYGTIRKIIWFWPPSRRTGSGRVMTNSFAPAAGCISQLKIHPLGIS